MQLRHLKSLTSPSEGIQKVTCLCWAPNGKKLAVCTTDRVVVMFDEEGNRKDKFSTKPAEKGPKNYLVKAMAFSPQSDKLAVAQTDNMVFVYKLGADWNDKKSICNKFTMNCPVTTLSWPLRSPNELYFGLAEGKVKIGQMKTHKALTLYQTESYVTAMSANPTGNAIVCAHLDGSIYTFWLENPDRGARLIARHNCPPFALSWGKSIVVAGNNRIVTFYDEDGGEEASFNYVKEPKCREFTTAVSNPTGDSVVLGNFDSMYVYSYNKLTESWEEKCITRVENMYSVTAMDWKTDGSSVIVGTLCGIVDMYDICLRRTIYKEFEMTYVSQSQVIVRHIESGTKLVIRSRHGFEILKTNIYKNRFVVANTEGTILLGDLESLASSEVPWHGNGTEKYIFDNPSACIVYFAGEVSVIEYGGNEILGSVRTSFTSPHLLSLRINERPLRDRQNEDNKKIAFLLDAQTICIKDLVTLASETIAHDIKIDWLELNSRANMLLFRDKRHHLNLYTVDTQTKIQLLDFATYVQWVPQSDVVVAQNRSNLCVWYNISAPDQVTINPIKGDIEEIERVDGKTEVVVDEGLTQAYYALNESLIEFATAIDDNNLFYAMDILDRLELTSETEAMWQKLNTMAIMNCEFRIAQRCAAAMGNVALSKYLGELNDIRHAAEEEFGMQGVDYYKVRAMMYLMDKDLKSAEDVLLTQGRINECIEMYNKLHKYDLAIKVAEQVKHPDTQEMRRAYFQYLLDTNQEAQAAALKEKELDFNQAINLYLKGGMPAKAANVVLENNIRSPSHLLETIVNALIRAGMHDLAGDFYELLNDLQKAMDSYVRGHAYRKAVELARRSFPSQVVELQEQWGDYLVSLKQIDMAINHYIEAKVYQKAIEAALNARQYTRALQLVDAIDTDSARPYYKQLARHYEESSQFDLAERCYVAADQPELAVAMHTKLGHWELAHKLAMSYMTEGEVGLLYINQAQKLESEGKFKEAEKMYLTVKEKDLAINMYKKNRRFDDMIRLVKDQRPDLLKETHQYLAQTLEVEGSLREAEHHYVEAQEWHSAVNMYRSNELWDDAIRVAKLYGGTNACKRVTIALLMAVGIPEGNKYLTKHGLVEAAIEHASENSAFDMAFELANLSAPKKLPEIHLKYALFLEDEEQFPAAEEEFIKANKPKEAIDMYVHQQDWNNAIRVAENYDPASVSDVYIAHARVQADKSNYKAAEELYLAASRPELALNMYQDLEMWQEALRLAQLHLPHRVAEVTRYVQSVQAKSGKGNSKKEFLTSGKLCEQNKQWTQAIDTYLAARKDVIENVNDLEDLWDRAIEIARNHVPNRYVEVALDVSNRLVSIGREETAADYLFDINRQDQAISVCIAAKKFDKAKELSQGNPSLRKRVDDALQSHLVQREDGAGQLVDIGKTDVALDVLAKRNEWTRLWEVAAKEKISPSVLAKYVVMRCEQLLAGNGDNIDEAIELLNTRPGPTSESSIPFYQKVVFRVLSKNKRQEGSRQAEVVSTLREILFRVAKQLKNNNTDKQQQQAFEEALMATHYMHMFNSCVQNNLNEIAAKCAITLLKYPDYIASDKAHYLAGTSCREVGNQNLAFMLLNRYVDLIDAIDTKDSSLLESADFQEADALPILEAVPTFHYLNDEDDREDVRTWVLSAVTDQDIDQRLVARERSKNTLYDGIYSTERPTCIVTGFPVYPNELLEVNNSTANRRDWNALVNKIRVCPWTGQPQNPIY